MLVGLVGISVVMNCAGVAYDAAPAAAQEAASAPTCAAFAWTPAAALDLAAEADASAREGLDPRRYQAVALRRSAANGSSAELDLLSRTTAEVLASDYLLGRVRDRAAHAWHIGRTDEDLVRLREELLRAERAGATRVWLRSLLPADPRYAALREAYAALPASSVERGRLRANLERWRWLPRNLGDRYVAVNVPAYTLGVVDRGLPDLTYDVVVGAPSTPTPQIAAPAHAVVLNPWWHVPGSIRRSSHLSAGRGFVAGPGGGIAQPPGPRNALGRVKVDMANPYAVYLHDTPAKALFARPSRAASHGCVRVKDIERLAADLLARDGGDATAVDRGLKGRRTASVPLHRPRPVYLLYFTVEPDGAGGLRWHEDPYGRDVRLARELARLDVAAEQTAAVGRAARTG